MEQGAGELCCVPLYPGMIYFTLEASPIISADCSLWPQSLAQASGPQPIFLAHFRGHSKSARPNQGLRLPQICSFLALPGLVNGTTSYLVAVMIKLSVFFGFFPLSLNILVVTKSQLV